MAAGGAARRTEEQDLAPTIDLGGLERTLGFQLRLAELAVSREFAERFAALEVSPMLYSALVLIEKNPRCRQTDLATALAVRQPNMVERIDTLVERGLVSRSADPQDRRANVLSLTPAGRRFMVKVRQVHDRLTRHLVSRLGDEDYDKLIEILARLR